MLPLAVRPAEELRFVPLTLGEGSRKPIIRSMAGQNMQDLDDTSFRALTNIKGDNKCRQ